MSVGASKREADHKLRITRARASHLVISQLICTSGVTLMKLTSFAILLFVSSQKLDALETQTGELRLLRINSELKKLSSNRENSSNKPKADNRASQR